MTGEYVTEKVKRKVDLLTDVDAQFVSLVRHGANKMPFRIIKEDKGGDGALDFVVQSVVVPKGLPISELAGEENLSWLNDIAKEAKDFDGYARYELLEASKFDDSTLNMVKLSEKGGWAIVGKVLGGVDVKEALTIGKNEVEKMMEVPLSPMNAVVAETPRESFAVTFQDMFDRELSSLLDVTRGVLNQTGADMKKRKATVLNAVDAFRSFLSASLDSINEGKSSTKKEVGELADKSVTRILKTIEEKGGNFDMFKSTDEFNEAVTGLIMKAFEERDAKASNDADSAAAIKHQKEFEENVAKMATAVDELVAGHADLVKKHDELSVQLGTETAHPDDDKQKTKKEDGPSLNDQDEIIFGEKKASVGVFSGLLSGKRTKEEASE